MVPQKENTLLHKRRWGGNLSSHFGNLNGERLCNPYSISVQPEDPWVSGARKWGESRVQTCSSQYKT